MIGPDDHDPRGPYPRPTSDLDVDGPMDLAEARERLLELRLGKRAPRPRDRMALDIAIDWLNRLERRLQQGGDPPAPGAGKDGQ